MLTRGVIRKKQTYYELAFLMCGIKVNVSMNKETYIHCWPRQYTQIDMINFVSLRTGNLLTNNLVILYTEKRWFISNSRYINHVAIHQYEVRRAVGTKRYLYSGTSFEDHTIKLSYKHYISMYILSLSDVHFVPKTLHACKKDIALLKLEPLLPS